MKLNREQLERVVPEDSIRAAFMARPDVAELPEEEREQKWVEHLKILQPFMDFLTRTEVYILPSKEQSEESWN